MRAALEMRSELQVEVHVVFEHLMMRLLGVPDFESRPHAAADHEAHGESRLRHRRGGVHGRADRIDHADMPRIDELDESGDVCRAVVRTSWRERATGEGDASARNDDWLAIPRDVRPIDCAADQVVRARHHRHARGHRDREGTPAEKCALRAYEVA
jgi:hypothetical protein